MTSLVKHWELRQQGSEETKDVRTNEENALGTVNWDAPPASRRPTPWKLEQFWWCRGGGTSPAVDSLASPTASRGQTVQSISYWLIFISFFEGSSLQLEDPLSDPINHLSLYFVPSSFCLKPRSQLPCCSVYYNSDNFSTRDNCLDAVLPVGGGAPRAERSTGGRAAAGNWRRGAGAGRAVGGWGAATCRALRASFRPSAPTSGRPAMAAPARGWSKRGFCWSSWCPGGITRITKSNRCESTEQA